jgi:hypothetical protein
LSAFESFMAEKIHQFIILLLFESIKFYCFLNIFCTSVFNEPTLH